MSRRYYQQSTSRSVPVRMKQSSRVEPCITLHLECHEEPLTYSQFQAAKHAKAEYVRSQQIIAAAKEGRLVFLPDGRTRILEKPFSEIPQIQELARRKPRPSPVVISLPSPPVSPNSVSPYMLSKPSTPVTPTTSGRESPDIIFVGEILPNPSLKPIPPKPSPSFKPISPKPSIALKPISQRPSPSLKPIPPKPLPSPKPISQQVARRPSNTARDSPPSAPPRRTPPNNASPLLRQPNSSEQPMSPFTQYLKAAIEYPSLTKASAEEKKRARKPISGESSGSASSNWVPLDEYYYGKTEGNPAYTEHKGEFRFKCFQCNKMLYNNVATMLHVQGHIDTERQVNLDISDLTQCKHCFKQFDTPFEMQTHIERVHMNNLNVLLCRICEKDHNSRGLLTDHMRKCHNACEMPYVCQLCKFRSSMYSDVVDHFKKKHCSSQYFLCLYCLRVFTPRFVSQGFGQTQIFYNHLFKHQLKNSTKKCQLCKLIFLNSADLKEHRRKDHVPNQKGAIAMNAKYSVPDQVMIKVVTDTGDARQGAGGIKSLNVPTIKKVLEQRLIISASTHTAECVECRTLFGSTDHFSKYIQCSLCRFATSCSFAYTNHMMSFHSGQHTAIPIHSAVERQLEAVMYCACGYSSQYGNLIATHLVSCSKTYCSTEAPSPSHNVLLDEFGRALKDPRKKPGASLLDILGLVKKDSFSPFRTTSKMVRPESPPPPPVEMPEVSVADPPPRRLSLLKDSLKKPSFKTILTESKSFSDIESKASTSLDSSPSTASQDSPSTVTSTVTFDRSVKREAENRESWASKPKRVKLTTKMRTSDEGSIIVPIEVKDIQDQEQTHAGGDNRSKESGKKDEIEDSARTENEGKIDAKVEEKVDEEIKESMKELLSETNRKKNVDGEKVMKVDAKVEEEKDVDEEKEMEVDKDNVRDESGRQEESKTLSEVNVEEDEKSDIQDTTQGGREQDKKSDIQDTTRGGREQDKKSDIQDTTRGGREQDKKSDIQDTTRGGREQDKNLGDGVAGDEEFTDDIQPVFDDRTQREKSIDDEMKKDDFERNVYPQSIDDDNEKEVEELLKEDEGGSKPLNDDADDKELEKRMDDDGGKEFEESEEGNETESKALNDADNAEVEEQKVRDEEIEEQKVRDEEIEEQKGRDEEIEEQKGRDEEIEEQKGRDEEIKEQKGRDEEIEEHKVRDEEIEEQKGRDEEIEEQKGKDEEIEKQKGRDEEIEEQKGRDELTEEKYDDAGKRMEEQIDDYKENEEMEDQKAIDEEKIMDEYEKDIEEEKNDEKKEIEHTNIDEMTKQKDDSIDKEVEEKVDDFDEEIKEKDDDIGKDIEKEKGVIDGDQTAIADEKDEDNTELNSADEKAIGNDDIDSAKDMEEETEWENNDVMKKMSKDDDNLLKDIEGDVLKEADKEKDDGGRISMEEDDLLNENDNEKPNSFDESTKQNIVFSEDTEGDQNKDRNVRSDLNEPENREERAVPDSHTAKCDVQNEHTSDMSDKFVSGCTKNTEETVSSPTTVSNPVVDLGKEMQPTEGSAQEGQMPVEDQVGKDVARSSGQRDAVSSSSSSSTLDRGLREVSESSSKERRDRSRSRDRERHRDRDRDRHRDRDRDYYKDRDRHDRSDRDRHREDDRRRDRHRDYDRGRERDRSRERHRERDRSRERHRSRERDRDRDRDYHKHRDDRRNYR